MPTSSQLWVAEVWGNMQCEITNARWKQSGICWIPTLFRLSRSMPRKCKMTTLVPLFESFFATFLNPFNFINFSFPTSNWRRTDQKTQQRRKMRLPSGNCLNINRRRTHCPRRARRLELDRFQTRDLVESFIHNMVTLSDGYSCSVSPWTAEPSRVAQ
jgi:hypothetical protein